MVLEYIKNLFRTKTDARKTYRIQHNAELGYCAEHYKSSIHGWYTLSDNGTIGAHTNIAVDYPEYWVKTMDEAGKRCNKHATSHDRKIVWSA